MSGKKLLFGGIAVLCLVGIFQVFKFISLSSQLKRAPLTSSKMSKVLTRKGLLQYIQSSKALSASSRQIVLGNESGDLDSSISSIVYSYFLSVNGKDEILPVLNYPSSDFVLRPETKAMFDKSNIRSSDLVFKDQIDFQSSNLEYVYLVDHNRLSRSQSFLAPKVISVIDHHVDESDSLVNLKYKKIETVGSACTIVAEDILKEYSLDESIATLLLSAILSDTFNLDTNGDRTTDKDIHIAKQLASFINPNESEKNVYSSIFEYVETAKYDTSSISSFDLLRKDYKQWTIERDNNKNSTIMGISAVPLSFEEWDNRDSNLSLQFEKYSFQQVCYIVHFYDP